jgi:hypothetical protein
MTDELEMIVKGSGHGITKYSASRQTENNHEKSQASHCTGEDSNQAPSDYESMVLLLCQPAQFRHVTLKLICSVTEK